MEVTMAVERGMITTVTDETNIIVDISEAIDQLSPTDTPLISTVGRDSLHDPCEQVKHEWMEDELRPRSGTIGAAYTAGSGALVLTSGQEKYLYVDDLILIGTNNVLQILAGPPDSANCTVTGGVGDSTDANAASGATWRKVSHAAPEGGMSRTEASKTVIVKPYNYTQILKDWCMVSGTMDVIKRYGYASERAYQEAKVLEQLAIDFEFSLIYGVRSYDAGPPRRSTMGGLAHYVYHAGIAGSWGTVYNAAGAAITETMLNEVLQAVFEKGGKPDTLVVNGYNQRQITRWATPRIRTDRDERMAGAHIGSYESDFGVLDLILNRWLISSDILILTKSEIGIGPLNGRAFGSKLVPSLGDYTLYEVLGEYTMEVHKPSVAHGWIYGTATS